MHDIKKYAVIVAGGKGTRMGNAMPKQFLNLNGKPVLSYAIAAFTAAVPDIQIILVLPPDMLSYAQMVLRALPEPVELTLIAGGETRFHSVQNGLNAIDEAGIVFIHDGARPLLSAELIIRCFNAAIEQGSAIPAIAVAESLRQLNGENSAPVNRDNIRIIQTPQTFHTNIILPAFKQAFQPGFTDEATVVESFGSKVYLVEGDRKNLKLTTPEDMIIAEAFLNESALSC